MKYRQLGKTGPRVSAIGLGRGTQPVRFGEPLEQEFNASIALAWLLAQGDDIVPIPGTNHVRNIELNAAAVDIELSADELLRLGQVFAPGAGAGERYMPNVLEGVGL